MSSPIARCPRCGHHSRFEGRAGSVVRCSCGADLVLSDVGLPPLGTRFGDLSPEQRAALPVGTRLGGVGRLSPLDKIRAGQWIDDDNRVVYENCVALLREIQYLPRLPREPDPRDSDGPDSDEGGGEMRGGDNDHDGDVPEVAGWTIDGWVCGRPWRGRWDVDFDTFSETREGITNPGGLWRVLRLYWPRDCEGAEDAPRDCLEGA